jgi:adenosylcobyric acid synthase
MVLGTTSGAGKSLIVTALCRIFSNMGYTVSPYKSQNMSLNSFVTPEGDEIARIQDLQARAARASPTGLMNPILLKPKHDNVSQVIIYGAPYADMDVPTYYSKFVPAMGKKVLIESISSIKRRNDIVIMEGAGSPAEINIGTGDIANIAAAEAADAPCILVVNVERGGSFAYVYGTVMLLSPDQRARIRGIVYNNIRGEGALLTDGIRELERMTGIPCIGVIPHMELSLPSEDSQSLRDKAVCNAQTRIGVIRLPRISNFTDFDAFSLEQGVSVSYVDTPEGIRTADVIIIPGTKHTLGDLAWMRGRGLDTAILDKVGTVPIIGICGGYQMMGTAIHDSGCIESESPVTEKGLGIIPVITRFDTYEKETVQSEGTLAVGNGGEVRGYEIHMGSTERQGCSPLCILRKGLNTAEEGVSDEKRRVYGTYLHGIFDLPAFRRYVLSIAGAGNEESMCDAGDSADERMEREIDALARTVRASMDIESLCNLMGVRNLHD